MRSDLRGFPPDVENRLGPSQALGMDTCEFRLDVLAIFVNSVGVKLG